MKAARRFIVMLIVLSLASAAAAQEVYRWVDENGVVNFSDTAPGAADASVNVNTVALEDTTPRDYDPEADIYNVAAQAERMQALRERMDRDREALRKQQSSAPQQPAPQYQTGVNYGYPYGYPVRPRPPIKPPIKPTPPLPEPYETSTLVPPSQWPDLNDR